MYSKRLLPALCASLIFATCQRTTSTTDTTGTNSGVAAVGVRTTVEIQVRGTSAFVEQRDPQHPVAVILPTVAEHVPYVAWLPEAEQDLKGTAEPVQEPKSGIFHVHILDREELILATAPSQNPVLLSPSPGGTCNPGPGSNNLPCIPQVAALTTGTHAYNDAFVRAKDPAAEVAGRLQLDNGTLQAVVSDPCEWEIKKGGGTTTRTRLASRVNHTHEINGAMLKLQLRKLDKPYTVTDLVTVKPAGVDNKITVRFGNAMGVFPPADMILNGDTDRDFDVYYKLLQGVNDLPVLKRTTTCDGSSNEIVYCGPGWVKPTSTSTH